MSYPDPRLNSRADPRPAVDDALRDAGRRLLATAQETGAYGLAAQHLGETQPVVVVSGNTEPRSYTVMFNPRIVATADERSSGDEGSVSLPGIHVMVERPIWADIAFMDADGKPHQGRFEGFAARVAQHEIDQMLGKFFLDRVSKLKRDMALKKAKKHAG